MVTRPPVSLQRRFDRLLKALRDAVLQQQAVDDDFDGVILAAIERNRLVEIDEVAIDARADVTFLRVFLEFLLVFAFAAANHRREDHDAVVGLERENGLHDLLGGLAGDGLAAIGAMRRADRAVDDAQIIVNFGDGADGGTRRARGGFLLDGDGRRKPFDRIDIGALHLVEELARVGGKRFDVAALALGVKGVEGERGFARTGETGDDGKRVSGNLEADVLEIVLPRAANDDFLEAHGVR